MTRTHSRNLFQAFANLRARNVDLSLAMMVPPKLFGRSQITPGGILRVKGIFPTEPQKIMFDMMFQRGPRGRWRLFSITADLATPKKANPLPGAFPPGGLQAAIQQRADPTFMPQASAESAPLPTRKRRATAP
jgi:hypothetical protein